MGTLSAWVAVNTVMNGRASESWPQVKGTVTSSEVTTSTDRGQALTESEDTFFPEVRYEYVVDDQTLEGYEIAYGGYSFSTLPEAENILATYPVGQVVNVFFDPDNADKAVLEPGLREFPYGFLLGGILFIVAGLVMIKLFPRPHVR